MSDNVKWIQWTSRRSGVTKAFAVDVDALDSKGPTRAINGSIVPEDAEPAKRSTEKDEFCLRIIESRKLKDAKVKERSKAKSARSKSAQATVNAVLDRKPRAVRKDKGQPRRAKAEAA